MPRPRYPCHDGVGGEYTPVLVIDLDGTICTQKDSNTYHLAEPVQPVIDKVNKFWLDGGRVIIHTARGMKTCRGNVEEIELRYRQMTERWLKENRVCFDELIFGKPPGDYYVDDKGMHVGDFASRDNLI